MLRIKLVINVLRCQRETDTDKQQKEKTDKHFCAIMFQLKFKHLHLISVNKLPNASINLGKKFKLN